jgi:hypothetical protein
MISDGERMSLEIALLLLELAQDERPNAIACKEDLLWATHSYVQAVLDPDYPPAQEAQELFTLIVATAAIANAKGSQH